jgi:MoaA/NifB/PqqE/SkfB family radical SAM enzyme
MLKLFLIALKKDSIKLSIKLMNLALNRYEFLKRKIKLRSYPPKLYIEIGNVCNLHCPMCLRQWYKRKEGVMSIDQLSYIIEQNPGLVGVGIGGWGEPLLHPRFPEILHLLTSKGIFIAFDTNATLINQEFLDVVERGVLLLKLVISVDSPVSGRIRDYPDFEVVHENIRKIAKLKKKIPFLMLSCTVSKSNLNEVEDIVRLARETGIYNVGVHSVIAFNERHFVGPFGPPSSEELSKVLSKAEALARRLGVKLFTHYPLASSQCEAPWTQMFIAWDGTVYPCCLYLSKPLGNIFEESLKEIWNGEKYIEFRKSFIKGEERFCKNCIEGNFHLNNIEGCC